MGEVQEQLGSHFEIRRLTREHSLWAATLFAHSHIFCSTVFPLCYPTKQTKRFNAFAKASAYLINHQIDSGLSYGVFDRDYKYNREESRQINGKLYWNPDDDSVSGHQLLEQMDFPLVSIALSYDGINPLDPKQMEDIIASLPVFKTIFGRLAELDKRDDSWKPTSAGQVLMRNASSTRREYEGRGLMAKTARWLMNHACAQGFQGIQIETLNDAVMHVWSNPPAPFKGRIVSEFSLENYEEKDDNGNFVNPFAPARQQATKIYVQLK